MSAVTIPTTVPGGTSGWRSVKTVRLHYLMDPMLYIGAPLITYFGLTAIFLIIAAISGTGDFGTSLGVIMVAMLLAHGFQSVTRLFSVSQALGLTRREYLAGAWLLGIIASAVLAILQTGTGVIDHATGGYGLGLNLVYSPVVFNHGAIAALATWFIALLGAFDAGLLMSTIKQRFGIMALWLTYLAVIVVGIGAAALIGYLDAWEQVGNWAGRVGPFGVALWAIPVEIVAAVVTYLFLRRTPA